MGRLRFDVEENKAHFLCGQVRVFTGVCRPILCGQSLLLLSFVYVSF